jgi:hypothetical protein
MCVELKLAAPPKERFAAAATIFESKTQADFQFFL